MDNHFWIEILCGEDSTIRAVLAHYNGIEGYGYTYLLANEVPDKDLARTHGEGFYHITVGKCPDDLWWNLTGLYPISAIESDRSFNRKLKRFLVGRFK